MGHITAWEEDYKGNNTSPSLQSPLANSWSPSCKCRGEAGWWRGPPARTLLSSAARLHRRASVYSWAATSCVIGVVQRLHRTYLIIWETSVGCARIIKVHLERQWRLWDFKFSWRRVLRRRLSSEMLRRVVSYKLTDVSEVLTTPNFKAILLSSSSYK